MRSRPRRRDLWVGLRPYGVGRVKPNAYKEVVRTVGENRDALPHALRILTRGVCDGCALGVAGLHDWTIDGLHLCSTRLNLLRLNTMPAMDHSRLADVAGLRRLDGRALRDLGRLAHPMVRVRGDDGFRRISWDEALGRIADRVRDAGGERIALYLTARGLTNEVYYAAQKAWRFLGSPHIDNAARLCHAPSTTALKQTIGVGATTISYSDLFAADLIVLWGSDVANSQPVVMKYLHKARGAGTKVAVVNPHREPGLDKYWVPSNLESALFGTRMCDLFVPVHAGGDISLILGVLKLLDGWGALDAGFVDEHTTGFEELRVSLAEHDLVDLSRSSGTSLGDMERFARMYAESERTVFVWSMGLTQHTFGADNVRALVNLALTRGNVGRPGAGLMPIRGHSGVQGGAEMGAYATTLPGGGAVDAAAAARLSDAWGFPVPDRPGYSAEEMLEAAGAGELDVLYSSGGNFLEVMPDPRLVEERLRAVPLRVHQDIVVSSQMLVDPGEEVVLLPAATRYEQRDGGTETTTERRIAFSPEIPGHTPGEARSEWEVFGDLAQAVDPKRAHLVSFASGWDLREEIARVVPDYDGIQHLRTTGDQVQWGGERLCEGGRFPTDDGRARFSVVAPPERGVPDGSLLMTTRRGKQFNTMVVDEHDPLTGAGRDAVFLAASDATERGLAHGDPVRVRSRTGVLEGRVHIASLRPGNAQMFFPEANRLLEAGAREPASGIPSYTAVVKIERAV